MVIKFKDKSASFANVGSIKVSDEVIWDRVSRRDFDNSAKKLNKAIQEWFDENAPDSMKGKYIARIPKESEIKRLPFFKDFRNHFAYGGKMHQLVGQYFIDRAGKIVTLCMGLIIGDDKCWYQHEIVDTLEVYSPVRVILERIRK